MKHHFMQINVAGTLQFLEASGALHRACTAQCVQQLTLATQGRLEGQIGVCSQKSDLAGGGRAADLFAAGWDIIC